MSTAASARAPAHSRTSAARSSPSAGRWRMSRRPKESSPGRLCSARRTARPAPAAPLPVDQTGSRLRRAAAGSRAIEFHPSKRQRAGADAEMASPCGSPARCRSPTRNSRRSRRALASTARSPRSSCFSSSWRALRFFRPGIVARRRAGRSSLGLCRLPRRSASMVGALNLISIAFAVLFVGIGRRFRHPVQRPLPGRNAFSIPPSTRAVARRGRRGRPLALAAAATPAASFLSADRLQRRFRARPHRRHRHDHRLFLLDHVLPALLTVLNRRPSRTGGRL